MKQRIFRVLTASTQPFRSLASGLRHVSITAMFVFAALFLVAAGSVSAVLQKSNGDHANKVRSNQNSTESAIEPGPVENSTESNTTMQTDNTDNPAQTGDVSNNSSTTVTVNGESITVLPNESYRRSYTTETDSGNTHVDISVENHSSSNTSDDTIRSRVRERTRLDVRTESSTSSSVDLNSR